MNTPSSWTSVSSGPFKVLMDELKATALLAYTGKRDTYLSIKPGVALAEIGIPADFVRTYFERHARHDVVGNLFNADPRIVERVSASQYTDFPPYVKPPADLDKRAAIRDYLRAHGFEHLLLAGLDSQLYGLAWAVAYRPKDGKPFSEADADLARYLVPSVLHRALREHAPGDSSPTIRVGTARDMLPLTPKELRVAIMQAQGFGPTRSVAELSLIGEKMETASLANMLTKVKKILQIETPRITMHDLETYQHRPRPEDDANDPHPAGSKVKRKS